MNKELQDIIYNKYPKLFAKKDLPYTQTCMYWGLEVGDGWFDIIDTACSLIQQYADKHPDIPQLEFDQVKEKFGALRMYHSGGDDYADGVISLAQNLSYNTCEDCGAPAKQASSGWIVTICEPCLNSRREARK